MRRLIFLCVLASAVLLLSACAGISITYKDTPTSSSGETANPADGVMPQTAGPSAAVVSGDSESTASPAEPSPGSETPTEPSPVSSAAPSGSGQAGAADAVKPSENGGNTASDAGAMPSPDSSMAPKQEGSPGEEPPSATPDTGTTPATAATPGSGAEQPPLLSEMLKKAGLTFSDLRFSQLVLVAADGSKATLYCYDKDENGFWKLNGDIGYINGYVGKNGVSTDKREGDGCTPAGLFGLGYAFGNSAKPETGMTWRAITEASYWVDDPDSNYYNQWVEGTDGADWDSAEDLSEMPKNYAYAVVVEYNTENTVAGKGSAIFLHCKTEPTSGCIAAPQEAILKILKWLSEEKNPGMFIVGE